MPRKRKPRAPEPSYERFYFTVEAWDFTHSLRVNLYGPSRRHFGPASDYRQIVLRGPIISRTKRKIERGELLVWPRGPEPDRWPEDLELVGVVMGLREGRLQLLHEVTQHAFQNVLTVLTAGRIAEFLVTIRDLRYGHGHIVSATIDTERTDPEDL